MVVTTLVVAIWIVAALIAKHVCGYGIGGCRTGRCIIGNSHGYPLGVSISTILAVSILVVTPLVVAMSVIPTVILLGEEEGHAVQYQNQISPHAPLALMM